MHTVSTISTNDSLTGCISGTPAHSRIRTRKVFGVFPCHERTISETLHLTFPRSVDGIGTSVTAPLTLATALKSPIDLWLVDPTDLAEPTGPTEGGTPR